MPENTEYKWGYRHGYNLAIMPYREGTPYGKGYVMGVRARLIDMAKGQ